jgi:cytochrome c-type biogenesis protein CcmE
MDALTIAGLLDYGAKVLDKPVKVMGVMKAGTLAGVDAAQRFVLADAESGAELPVKYAGALSDDTAEGSSLVLTGSIGSDGAFTATDVALEA